MTNGEPTTVWGVLVKNHGIAPDLFRDLPGVVAISHNTIVAGACVVIPDHINHYDVVTTVEHVLGNARLWTPNVSSKPSSWKHLGAHVEVTALAALTHCQCGCNSCSLCKRTTATNSRPCICTRKSTETCACPHTCATNLRGFCTRCNSQCPRGADTPCPRHRDVIDLATPMQKRAWWR